MSGAHASRRGFTLFELMIVLVILAITAAAAVPAFNAAAPAERRVATVIADALVAARDAARESASPATFVLSPADGRFWITTRRGTVTGIITPRAGSTIDADGHDRIGCRFDPAGTASPAEIHVEGAHAATVTVDRWSSDVHVSERAP